MNFNKYKEFGDYHWKEYAAKTAYGKHVDRLVKWIGKDANLLDIGAGDGLITSMFPNAFGIDDDKYALEISKQKNVNVVYGNAYSIPKDKKYDNVLLGDVIEHLEFPEKCLAEIRQVLNKNGNLFITTPPARSDGKISDKYHYVEYTQESLENLLKNNGFTLTEKIETITQYNRMYGKFCHASFNCEI